MIILKEPQKRVTRLLFSPDGLALTGPTQGGINVWRQFAPGNTPEVFKVLNSRGDFAFTHDSMRLLTLGSRFSSFDLATGVRTDLIPTSARCGQFALSHDGRLALFEVGQRPRHLICRPLANLAEMLWQQEQHCWSSTPVFNASGRTFFRMEGGWIASGRRVEFWFAAYSIETGDEIWRSEPLTNTPKWTMATEWAISPDGALLACLFQANVRFYPTRSPGAIQPIATIKNNTGHHFTDLAFHPSGKYLAATSNDQTVKLYDTATWQVAKTYTWDIGRMRSIAFSPDGTLAAAGSDTGKVVVWDVDV